MLVSEFLKTEQGIQLLTEIKSKGFYILEHRFSLLWSPYELIYSPERTYQIAFNLILSFSPALEIAETIHKDMVFEIENLGNTSTTTNESTTSGTATNTTSYTGYNVDGDYSKNSAQNENLNKGNAIIKSVNQIDELIKFTNSKIDNIYKTIDLEFEKLFISLY